MSSASWARRYRAWQTQAQDHLPPSIPPSESHTSQSQSSGLEGGLQDGGRASSENWDSPTDNYTERGTDEDETAYPSTDASQTDAASECLDKQQIWDDDDDDSDDDISFSDAWSVQHELELFTPPGNEGEEEDGAQDEGEDGHDQYGSSDGSDGTATGPASDLEDGLPASPTLSTGSFDSFPELANLTIDDVTGGYNGLDIPISRLTLDDHKPTHGPAAAKTSSSAEPLPL